MVDYIVRNHVAPRTKLHVPKDDCPILSKKSMFGDKRKRAWMYFVRQPSMIGEWMETSHCLNPGLVRHDSRCSTKNPPEGCILGSRQTDEETGHNKTGTYLAGRMVKHVEKPSAQSLKLAE